MIYRYRSDMGSNPASVDIRRGIVYINRDMWTRLTPYERAIVLLHEEGHYRNKSVDEIQADIYAINAYLADANTPKKRAELLNTIFKIVPDDKRKVEFVRHLMLYESTARNTPQSKAMYKALDEYSSNEANFVTEAIAIVNAAVALTGIGVDFWQKQKDRNTYWRSYEASKKDQIIHAAAQAAIQYKFLKSAGNYSATLAAAKLPYSNEDSLWCDTFVIIAAGVKFDPANFDDKASLTVGEASSIFWTNSGYPFNWMSDWVGYMKEDLETIWEGLSLFDKVKYSTKYKLYVLGFAALCFLVWKLS